MRVTSWLHPVMAAGLLALAAAAPSCAAPAGGTGQQKPGERAGQAQQKPGERAGQMQQKPGEHVGQAQQKPGQRTGQVQQKPRQRTGQVQQKPRQRTGHVQQKPGQRAGQMPQRRGEVPGLQLSADQQRQIAAIRNDTDRQVRGIRQDRSLTAQQRDQRIADAQRRAHERVLNILTPEQRQRFAARAQERSRVAGYRGGEKTPGATATVVPGVQLSQEQQQRIVTIRRDMMTRVEQIRSDSKLTAAQRDARIAEEQRRAHDEVMNVLTPQQRDQFRQHSMNRAKGST